MNPKKITEFIKELRTERNLSQEELADAINIDRSVISRLESGERSPTTDHLVLISNYFGITVDELLAGEKKTIENKEKIENINVVLYDDNIHFRRKIKLLIIIMFFMLFIGFAVFFFNFYGTLKVYNVVVNTEDIKIDDGLFLVSKEKIYFRIANVKTIDSVDSIRIFYKIDDKITDVLNTTKICNILIKDYYGYEEFFEFKEIDRIVKNLYIEVKLKDGKNINARLELEKDYENNTIFARKDKSIIKKMTENITFTKSKVNEKVNKLREKIGEDKINIKYKNKKYEIYFLINELKIIYYDEKIEHNLIYSDYESGEWFTKISVKNFYGEQIYSYNLSIDICNYGKCEIVNNDLELFTKVIDNILKKS